MKKLILTKILLLISMFVLSQQQANLIYEKATGQLYFKMQPKNAGSGGFLESLEFSERYKWRTYINKNVEITILINSTEKELIIPIDNNDLDIDNIALYKTNDKFDDKEKINKKHYSIYKLDKTTYLKMNLSLLKTETEKLHLIYSLKIELKSIINNFQWEINKSNLENFSSHFEFIMPQYLIFNVHTDTDLDIIKSQKTITEYFQYIPWQPGKVTTKEFRYTSTVFSYEKDDTKKLDNFIHINFERSLILPISD